MKEGKVSKKIKGKFITFEGPEGSGKSTHIKLLAPYLKEKGYKVELFREPGGTRIGEQIRQILLDPELNNMSRFCELCLYLAARVQLVEEKIVPLLKEGKVILCDRFNDATLAYQGYASGISVEFIRNVEKILFSKTVADLTILLDIDVETGLKRTLKNRLPDRLERKDITYHKKVRQGYLDLAKKYPERIKVISSKSSIETVQNKIRTLIEDAIK